MWSTESWLKVNPLRTKAYFSITSVAAWLIYQEESKAECRPLEAAAAAARESLGASVAGAQANVEVLERGVTESG